VQSTGPENVAPERAISDFIASRTVNSPSRITLENNGKIRPLSEGRTLSQWQVAEGMGLTSNLLLWMPLGLQGISDRLDM
jgi:hypothetical protein